MIHRLATQRTFMAHHIRGESLEGSKVSVQERIVKVQTRAMIITQILQVGIVGSGQQSGPTGDSMFEEPTSQCSHGPCHATTCWEGDNLQGDLSKVPDIGFMDFQIKLGNRPVHEAMYYAPNMYIQMRTLIPIEFGFYTRRFRTKKEEVYRQI